MRVLLLLLVMVATACATAPGHGQAVATTGARTTIHVVSHGWHTGIVLRRADVAHQPWPELADFPDAEYLEVGWGDRAYYQSPDPGAWLAIKALFWPTPSALHVVGLRGPVAEYFSGSEVISIEVPQAVVERLGAAIAASYARVDSARVAPIGPSLYGTGYFYPARESFHLFRTCNVWNATRLHEAGLPVSPSGALTAEGLLVQLRELRAASR